MGFTLSHRSARPVTGSISGSGMKRFQGDSSAVSNVMERHTTPRRRLGIVTGSARTFSKPEVGRFSVCGPRTGSRTARGKSPGC